jgi:hypothetical protein
MLALVILRAASIEISPDLPLKGRWLGKAGFSIGAKVRVMSHPGAW